MLLQTVVKLVFPSVCFLIGMASLVFKGGGFGLFVGLLFFSMGFLHIVSARFRLFIRTYGEAADPKDEFVVSRNEIVSGLKEMITDSGAIEAKQLSINSFRGTVEFAKCHEVLIALIPICLEQPDRPDEDSITVESGWGIAYFCPVDGTWKATPFFHFHKQSVIDAFGKSLSSILEVSMKTLK